MQLRFSVLLHEVCDDGEGGTEESKEHQELESVDDSLNFGPSVLARLVELSTAFPFDRHPDTHDLVEQEGEVEESADGRDANGDVGDLRAEGRRPDTVERVVELDASFDEVVDQQGSGSSDDEGQVETIRHLTDGEVEMAKLQKLTMLLRVVSSIRCSPAKMSQNEKSTV